MRDSVPPSRIVLTTGVIILSLSGVVGWILPALLASQGSLAVGSAVGSLPPWVSWVGIAVVVSAACVVARSGRRAIAMADLNPPQATHRVRRPASGHPGSDTAVSGSVLAGPLQAHTAAFMQRLRGEVARCNRYGHKLSVLSVCLDSPSPPESIRSDRVSRILGIIGEIVTNTIRVSDSFDRVGPRSLLVILAETETRGAQRVAEKLRRNVEVYPFDLSFPVTVSIGVSGHENGMTAEELTAAAEAGCQAAGAAGGNRVTTPEDLLTEE